MKTLFIVVLVLIVGVYLESLLGVESSQCLTGRLVESCTTTVRYVEEELNKLHHSFQTDGKKRDQEIETTKLQVRNLTSDLQTERIKSQNVSAELKETIVNLQTDNLLLKQSLETTKLQVRNLTSDLQTERIKSQNVSAELKETIVNLQTDNLLLKQSLETTKLQVRNLTSDLQTERQERIKSQNVSAELKETIVNLQTDNLLLKQSLETTKLQVRNLTSDLQTERIKSQNVSAELKETIVNLQTDNLLLKQSLETTKLQVRNLTSDLQTERQERIKSQNVSAELQETIVQIQRGNLLSNQSFETGVVDSVSSIDDLPSCGASTRGSIRLLPVSVNSALRRDAFIICADLENGKFQWIEVMTNGGIPTNGSSCRELIEPTYLSSVLPDGLYNLTDSNMDSVTGYCDMTTDGGGWLLIGKSFQPNVLNLDSTSDPVTLTSGQGWSNRFPSIVVNDFRVQFANSSSMEDTKGNWYYHLARPRPLAQLFTSGLFNANGCEGKDGITDIEYTVDIRGGTRNNNHRCSAFQDPGSNSFNGINNCFTSTGCSIPGDDGSFSFHGQNAISGQDISSTAFFGCDDNNCCACWGPNGGQETYCSNNCITINGGSKQSSGYAWFYVR